MYRIYETEAIILKSLPKGETGKSYVVLTKDLGLVRATAQGVRSQKSKLRPFLVDLRPISLSLVRGKELWRITNARQLENRNLLSARLLAYARVSNLVLSLVHGEEKDEKLFSLMKSLHADLLHESIDFLRTVEELYVLRILSSLGYVPSTSLLSPFLDHTTAINPLVSSFATVRREALQAINKALHATGM